MIILIRIARVKVCRSLIELQFFYAAISMQKTFRLLKNDRTVTPIRLQGYSGLSEATRSVIRPPSGRASILILKPLPSACA